MNKFEVFHQRKAGQPAHPLAIGKTQITPETPFQVRNALQPVLSPDGKTIAFLVGEWRSSQDQEKQSTRLWSMSYAANDEPRPLTKGERQDADPCWSPDSRYLAYSSKYEESNSAGLRGEGHPQPLFQLHVMDYNHNIEHQVCTTLSDVRTLAWSPDGQQISFLATREAPKEEDPIRLDGRKPLQRQLWRVYAQGDQALAITPPDVTIWSYAWSPDSKNIAVYYSEGPEQTDWYRGQIGLVSARGGAITRISELTRQAWSLAWSPDGQRLGYITGEWSDPDRGGGDIAIYTLQDQQTRNLTPGLDWSPTWLQWTPDGKRILSAGWSGTTTRISLFDEATSTETPLEKNFLIGDKYIPRLSTSQDLRHIVTTHSQHHPYDIWTSELPKTIDSKTNLTWQRRSRLNPIAEETLHIHPTEQIRYTGADGWQIDAIVTYPDQLPENELPPLVVNVHGGPSSLWLDDWDLYRSQVLAEAGYLVLRPDIRGSMGRGVAFADAVIGDMGGKDLQDILAGVDYLINKGLVDSTRVGIMGWSYGGFMTAWTVTQTQRFKAAVMGAGISDYHSFHAQTNIQDWDMRFLGSVGHPASPLNDGELYRQHSPITYANRVKTPTLIVHGERDACVPLNQAYAFYRALKEQDVPTKLVVYPREGHGPTERMHQLDYTKSFLDWFKRYL